MDIMTTTNDEKNADEERSHRRNVFDSYRQYATFHTTREIGIDNRRRRLLQSSSIAITVSPSIESILPTSHRSATSEYNHRQKLLRDAAIRNQYFLDCALRHSQQETSQEVLHRRRKNRHPKDEGRGDGHEGARMEEEEEEGWVTEEQISKVDSVLKSLARDWSAEGKDERSVAYDRIIGAIDSFYENNTTKSRNSPDYIHHRADVRIAVPGSGLGRLAWELHSRGYTVEGSDFSLPMLVASDFILNGRCVVRNGGDDVTTTSSQLRFAISPWLAETKNVLSIDNRVRTVIVPDIDPGIVLMQPPKEQHNEEAEFTMLAGEFLHLYSHFLPDQQQQQQTQPNDNNNNDKYSSSHHQRQKKFHVVAMSYFLDTAPSIPHYLETIYHMLEVGGFLVHFGPLMYHWSGHGSLLPGDDDDVVDINGGIATGESQYDITTHNIQKKSSYNRRNDRLDSRYLISIDYTWDEVREMLTNIGFEIIVEERNIPARYTSDACSMMHVVYDCVFCVARRIR